MLGSARDGAPGAQAPAPPGGKTSHLLAPGRLRVCMGSIGVGPILFSAGARGPGIAEPAPAPAPRPPVARAGARGPSK